MDRMERWKDGVALVTGATSGIGLSTARLLAGAGMKVAITARNRERLEALRTELDPQGGRILVVPADLRKEEEIHRMFGSIRQSWGGVKVLINNAGLGFQGLLADQPADDWREMMEVNVLAMTLCMQEALKDMEAAGEGHIINISSIVAHRVLPGKMTCYAASKHAVRAFTEGLRMELAARKSPVRLGMISPGMVVTEFHERATKGAGDPQSFYTQFKALTPEDVADVVLYLLGTPPHVNINDVIMRSVEQAH